MKYTRGTSIPLHLRVEGADEQALDLLSAPAAMQVQLKRRICYKTPTNANWQKKGNKTIFVAETKTSVSTTGTAVFWPSSEGSPEIHARSLFGEIRIPFNTVPSHAGIFFDVSVSDLI